MAGAEKWKDKPWVTRYSAQAERRFCFYAFIGLAVVCTILEAFGA